VFSDARLTSFGRRRFVKVGWLVDSEVGIEGIIEELSSSELVFRVVRLWRDI
jgi:hypothetical protein